MYENLEYEQSNCPPPQPSRIRRVRHALQSTGIRRTLTDLARLLRPKAALDHGADRAFDIRFGTDTSGRVESENLGFADSEANANAILYLPSPDHVTRWMVSAVGIDHQQFAFIDLGCGKGRVVVVASEFPFRRVIGVDLSATLVALAANNARIIAQRYPQRPPIEANVADAALYAFPDLPLLLHLYHPFKSAILARVLVNLKASVEAAPRRVVVAYLLYAAAADEVLATFSVHSWLPLVRREGSLMGEHDWLIFDSGAAAPGACPARPASVNAS